MRINRLLSSQSPYGRSEPLFYDSTFHFWGYTALWWCFGLLWFRFRRRPKWTPRKWSPWSHDGGVWEVSAKVRIPVFQDCQPRGIHYDGKRLNGTRLKCNSGAAMDLPSCSHTKGESVSLTELPYAKPIRHGYEKKVKTKRKIHKTSYTPSPIVRQKRTLFWWLVVYFLRENINSLPCLYLWYVRPLSSTLSRNSETTAIVLWIEELCHLLTEHRRAEIRTDRWLIPPMAESAYLWSAPMTLYSI